MGAGPTQLLTYQKLKNQMIYIGKSFIILGENIIMDVGLRQLFTVRVYQIYY